MTRLPCRSQLLRWVSRSHAADPKECCGLRQNVLVSWANQCRWFWLWTWTLQKSLRGLESFIIASTYLIRNCTAFWLTWAWHCNMLSIYAAHQSAKYRGLVGITSMYLLRDFLSLHNCNSLVPPADVCLTWFWKWWLTPQNPTSCGGPALRCCSAACITGIVVHRHG